MRIEKIKTALIALLTFCALLLCALTFAENRDFFNLKSAQTRLKSYITSQTTNPGLPACFVLVRDGVSTAVKTDNSVKTLFDSAGGILLESLGSSDNFAEIDEKAYISALKGNGLLFAYSGSLPLSVISSGKFLSSLSASSIFLSSAEEGLKIYVEDAATGKFYLAPSALKSTALSSLSPAGYPAFLACSLFPDSSLPASACFSSEPSGGELTLAAAAENGVYPDDLALALLSAFMGNTYTSRSFTDAEGCRNYLIDGGRIRLGKDGYVCFSAETAAGISLEAFDIALSSDALADACRAALAVMSAAVDGLGGDLRYCVRGVSIDKDEKISVTLGALCEGCPVVREGGSSTWAYFEFKDGYLTRAELSLYAGKLTQNALDRPALTPELIRTGFAGKTAGKWLTPCYVASPDGVYTKNWLALSFPD